MRIGDAGVSTDAQNLALQVVALTGAGFDRIFEDAGVSAVARSRPQFAAALEMLRPGDTLVIWKMDRAFHSLTDAIDTHTPMGRFAF